MTTPAAIPNPLRVRTISLWGVAPRSLEEAFYFACHVGRFSSQLCADWRKRVEEYV